MTLKCIKDRCILWKQNKSIVYIGMVCNHFCFMCSSATSNIEPLGKEKAFLKASFSSLVLSMKRQQTLLTTSSTEQMFCGVHHHQKENERQRWNPSLSMHLSSSFACRSCQFSSISVLSAYFWPITLSHPKAEFPVPDVLQYSSPTCALLWKEDRLNSKFRVSSCGNSSVPSWVFLHEKLLIFFLTQKVANLKEEIHVFLHRSSSCFLNKCFKLN